MIDKKNRAKAAKLIREFLDYRLTNNEFDEQYPHNSYDPAIQSIGVTLWSYWSDLETYILDNEHSLSERQRHLFERCILFLKTQEEYVGPPIHVDPFAWLKRIWQRFVVPRHGSQPYHVDTDQWWPFSSENEYEFYVAQQSHNP